MRSPIKAVILGGLVVALAACGSAKDANKGNFSKAIQAYLDTQNGLCAALPAKSLPFTLADQDMLSQQGKQRADALVDAGLLSKRDVEVKAMFGNRMLPGAEYSITDEGKKYLVAGGASTMMRQDAFCTGKYAMAEVQNFTEPSDMMGAKVSRVNFLYKLDGAASWAKSASLQQAYPAFAKQTQGDIKGKAALILTNDGWVHERLFKR
ncbi:hypothetical protein BBB39_01810 [Bordetella trematum]|uniref:Lipoprotein n=1 Tax=Bordetella trematum TaxID=123899 RepID=A0A157RAD2_9BORD|nr:hypothetical protein [Bordetella trematum]AZR95946.1 hypothetical protein BBB39_01810 [Bordetella trematum]NNH19638.1 hypothetical protein [Bordetella trematum]SAI54942.1 Uncharacterised protein [Bordetella trematum]SAI68946.1 Uncharacterised protein [Bordetella trematum]SUV99502.1 Uncharacterised protein [Bordetella trematum]